MNRTYITIRWFKATVCILFPFLIVNPLGVAQIDLVISIILQGTQASVDKKGQMQVWASNIKEMLDIKHSK